MDSNNPVIQLCISGTRAEFEGRYNVAYSHYQQAWNVAQNDFEACIAAHYLARFQETPEEKLRWNQVALEHAKVVTGQSVDEFYPSLYLNLGYAHEQLGQLDEAEHYYALAAALGFPHQPD